MWSKNGIPVLIDAFPLPSIASFRRILVSFVTRCNCACRFSIWRTKPNPHTKTKPKSWQSIKSVEFPTKNGCFPTADEHELALHRCTRLGRIIK